MNGAGTDYVSDSTGSVFDPISSGTQQNYGYIHNGENQPDEVGELSSSLFPRLSLGQDEHDAHLGGFASGFLLSNTNDSSDMGVQENRYMPYAIGDGTVQYYS